jgi:tetrahydromethanopterin S-methyltransferase subunit G
MQATPDPASETPTRKNRRRIAPVVGAIAGAVVGLIVAGLVDVFEGSVTPVAYLGGVLVGAVIGLVLAMLVPAEIDDGADDAHAAPFGHDALPGRADAPVEGAHARDTRS